MKQQTSTILRRCLRKEMEKAASAAEYYPNWMNNPGQQTKRSRQALFAALDTAADAAAAIAPGVRASDIRRRESLEFKRYYDLAIDWDALDVTRAVSLLQTIDAKARAKDPEIIQVQVTISWQQRTTMVNTSDGIDAFDNKPYYSLRMNTVIKHGEEIQSNGSNFADLDSFEAITPERVEAMIDEAIADTRILFEAVKPKGGEWPVVLGAGASGILLHEAIGHGLEADFNRKEASIFATKMNQRVASDEVTIYDSGLFEKSRGALNVDDEGTPGQKTVLVENGVLRSYLHDKIRRRPATDAASPTSFIRNRACASRVWITARTSLRNSSAGSSTASIVARLRTARFTSVRATTRSMSKTDFSLRTARLPRRSRTSTSLATVQTRCRRSRWWPTISSVTKAAGRAARTARVCPFRWGCRRFSFHPSPWEVTDHGRI